MSLKAKLEAVIYAAEEPVTLAQLAALFAAEAFEHKAALAEQLPEAELLPLINETVPESGETEPVAEAAAESGAAEAQSAAREVPDAESDAKREAKARDREVKAILKSILADLIATYEADDRGIEIREIAGGYRMAPKPSCHDAVRLFVKSLKPPLKLSLPALETLAVIAYKQPVTAPEVSEIRGVESGGVLGSLMARKLIATAGRKQVIGRPILYKTTREFLLCFGLKDISELPSMEEFEKIAAVEIEEMEPAGTAASESASNESEPSPQAETEAEPHGSEEIRQDSGEEDSSKEDGSKEDSGEEIRSEEGGEGTVAGTDGLSEAEEVR